jgi:hypothetical protein
VTITAPPADVPDINDPVTFAARAAAWVAWQAVAFPELNTDFNNSFQLNTHYTLTAGYDSDAQALGTIVSGTVTPEVDDVGKENFKTLTNNGAFILATPATSATTTIRIRVINGASAGTITSTAYDAVYGDEYVTTSGKEFWFYIDHDDTRDTLMIKEIV